MADEKDWNGDELEEDIESEETATESTTARPAVPEGRRVIREEGAAKGGGAHGKRFT